MKKEITRELRLIAACGLYCGACGKFLKDKCPGCKENTKASWCNIRTCCSDKGIDNCSMCDIYSNPNDCAKYNNFVARVFGFITGSDRSACIELIKQKGPEAFVDFMVNRSFQSIPRKYKFLE
jgi:hypothetical protein